VGQLVEARWVEQEELCRELNLSRSSVYRLRKLGYIRAGAHWHRCSPGSRGRLAFNPDAIRLALQLFLSR
jgi:hypothetical protein